MAKRGERRAKNGSGAQKKRQARTKRNPQDTTLRNIRAVKARVARLELLLKWALADIKALQDVNRPEDMVS